MSGLMEGFKQLFAIQHPGIQWLRNLGIRTGSSISAKKQSATNPHVKSTISKPRRVVAAFLGALTVQRKGGLFSLYSCLTSFLTMSE